MSTRHQDVRQWAKSLLFAIVAISALVSTASATSEQPEKACPPAKQEAVAALNGEMQVLITRSQPLSPTVQARLAARVDRLRDAEAIKLEVLRHEIEAIELGTGWHEANAAAFAFTLRDVAVAEEHRALAALDRGLDAWELRGWQDEWDAFVEEKTSARSGAISAGVDLLVSIARVPARAALTVRHLVEAFAKVTPHVVDVLL